MDDPGPLPPLHDTMVSDMMRIRAVIFDCDGVLFDSSLANTHYYNHLLAHFHLPLMKPDEEAFVHMHTADESVHHIFRRATAFESKAQDYRAKMDYTPFINDMIMEPGLIPLLKALKPRFGLAVATNRSNTISEVLRKNGLEGFFDIVVSSLDVLHPKPHPESIDKILFFFHISPREAVYVGDSLVDHETARAAGVFFVAYKNPELTADYHATGFLDVSDLLGISRKS
jgi:phosphoglycolate phosphatase